MSVGKTCGFRSLTTSHQNPKSPFLQTSDDLAVAAPEKVLHLLDAFVDGKATGIVKEFGPAYTPVDKVSPV